MNRLLSKIAFPCYKIFFAYEILNLISIYVYIYIIYLNQSSLRSKHVPDKIHFVGSDYSPLSIFRFALNIYVGPLVVV